MIDKDGRKRVRIPGQPRKSQYINDNLGHPYDIKNMDVIFIGKEKNPYCLTKNKKYKIYGHAMSSKWFFDNSLDKLGKRVERNQNDDYLIQIINDKGHKRHYPHILFRKIK